MIKSKIIRGLIIVGNYILSPVLYIGSLVYIFIKYGTDEFIEAFIVYSRNFWGDLKDGYRLNLQFWKDGDLDQFFRGLGL